MSHQRIINRLHYTIRMSIDLKNLKALAFDVDGTLTDGALYWGGNGEELKRFTFADIMGISLARRAGYKLALISGENSPLVDRYAAKLHITEVAKGVRDKATALKEFATRNDLDLSEICFMGDDVNDLSAIKIAGYSAAPANANSEVLRQVNFVCKKDGGHGAVRELVDALLSARGLDPEATFHIKL
jgi:3-deoxy-D-manno-octulosonate 8-phosphate phosphatase (KDO 8-P phosphatase)